MRATLRSLVCALAVAFAVAAPAYAQQQRVGTDPSETQAPVCNGTTEAAPPASCTSGDSADGVSDATVGGGHVITDPADDVEGDGSNSAQEPHKRGELHVLGNSAIASSQHERSAAPAQAGRGAPLPSAPSAPAEQEPTAPRATSSKTLPFTGVNAGYLALAGATLLLAGMTLRRRLATL